MSSDYQIDPGSMMLIFRLNKPVPKGRVAAPLQIGLSGRSI
jgi:hypothetical protein